ncbi:MAG TPA: glycosyltransferase [Hanamia sp.]
MDYLINSPFVSVVIATYNGERYLKEQLDSVFEQTYPNLEIIVVDDYSSDTTVSILHQFALLHSNMKVFANERNIGPIKTFEKRNILINWQLYCSLRSKRYLGQT